MKTADLQRGLIFSYDGREIVGEGMGIGVPVVEYIDNAYFSKEANLGQTSRFSVKKEFSIDTVELVKMGRHVVGKGQGKLANLYRSHATLRKPIIKTSQFMRKLVNLRSEFITAVSKGTVTMIYEVFPRRIHVRCDLGKLDKSGCKKIYILNEQGSSFFRKYEDSDGACLVDDQIGAWEEVKAERACLSDLNSSLRFCLQNVSNEVIWLGRETHEDLAWAGFIHQISPNSNFFDYDIFIEY